MKKLKNDRGETLVEVLAAILIATLSVTLLFSSVMVSSRMDANAKAMDSGYYANFSNAELQTGDPLNEDVTVKVKRVAPTDLDSVLASAAPTIEIYGSSGVYSYKRK